MVRDNIGYDTNAEASAALPGIVASRDTRWDDREAIVFLDDVYKQKGHYLLGYVTMFGEDAYTVASPWYREWLPDARSSTSSATGSAAGSGSSDQRFLLNDPAKAEFRRRVRTIRRAIGYNDRSHTDDNPECSEDTGRRPEKRG